MVRGRPFKLSLFDATSPAHPRMTFGEGLSATSSRIAFSQDDRYLLLPAMQPAMQNDGTFAHGPAQETILVFDLEQAKEVRRYRDTARGLFPAR